MSRQYTLGQRSGSRPVASSALSTDDLVEDPPRLDPPPPPPLFFPVVFF